MRTIVVGLVALALMAFVPAFADDLEQSLRTLGTDLAAQLSKKGAKKVTVDGFTDLNGYKSTLGDFRWGAHHHVNR